MPLRSKDLLTIEQLPLEEINLIVAAGNTTMGHFLLGLTPCSIRLDPYVPTADVYPPILAKDIGIHIPPTGVLVNIPNVRSYGGGVSRRCVVVLVFVRLCFVVFLFDFVCS